MAYLLQKYFGVDVQKNSGNFIEFGAFDGIQHSNTYLFEKLGWQGVLVEPDKKNYAKCVANRSVKVIEACVVGNNHNGEKVEFCAVDEDGELSSVVGFGKKVSAQMASAVYEVPAVCLDTLLADLKSVDVLSVDTEGSEYELLSNCEFKVRPKIIVVEHNE